MMTDREEFEAWYEKWKSVNGYYDMSNIVNHYTWQARGELDAVKIKELEASNAYMKELSYVKDGRIKELEEQLDIKQTMPMKYKRMAFNAQLQKENDELTAKLDKAREALSVALTWSDYGTDDTAEIMRCTDAIRELDK